MKVLECSLHFYRLRIKHSYRKNVWLGANVTVLPGVTIGDGAIIAAGAVVTKDIPENMIAVGVPAKVMRAVKKEDNKGEI